MILMIDNYDSFTYNIVQYLKQLGEQIYTVRNDSIDFEFIDNKLKPRCIFISPGPKSPIDAGQCLEIILRYKGVIPIFGVCLGHQCIGQAFGGNIVKAQQLMHGKNSELTSLNKGIFHDFPKEKFSATRYHSLVIEKRSLPDCLEITCESEDGEIMGIRHKDYLIEGVQFHPEAIMSEYGMEIFKRFLDKCSPSPTISDLNKPQLEERKSIATKNKVQFEQKIEKYPLNRSFYNVFLDLYSSERYQKCAFFDSASGPRKDLNISVIGIDCLFSLSLKDKTLYVHSDYPLYKQLIDSILNTLQEIEGGFSLKDKRFSEVYQLMRDGIELTKSETNCNLPLSFPLIGYFGYEYIHYLEQIPEVVNDSLNLPDMELHFYSTLLIHEVDSNELHLINNCIKGKDIDNKFVVDSLNKKDETATTQVSAQPSLTPLNGDRTISKEEYLDVIEKNKEYVINGDIFQVQISIREKLNLSVEAIELYSELRKINPSPYMCFFKSDNFELVCNSPELQFSIKDNEAMIRPIAGTSPGKGHNEKSRKQILEKFSHDAKENAEHLMLVDLARNDLGRMAATGTVKIDELMAIEEYANVFHLTSTVTCQLQEGLNPFELFEATFPAGTLTGAPKIRAMEIIAEHEPVKRGLYGGAIGIFDLDYNNMMSSIIIRSVICKDNTLYLQAAAGTVADSIPEKEWEEINHKLSTVKKAIANVTK